MAVKPVGMAGVGVFPGYIKQAQPPSVPKPKPPPVGTTPATKAGLLPYTEGQLNITGVPRIAPPSSIVTNPMPTVPDDPAAQYQPTLDEIMNYPTAALARENYNTDLQTLMKALRASIGQAVIKGGYDPTARWQKFLAENPGYEDFTDLISPTALASAATNPRSDRALAAEAEARGLDNLSYRLAARGMSGSGAYATGSNKLTRERQLTEQNTLDQLIAAITGGISNYNAQKIAGRNAVEDAYAQAAAILAGQAV